MTDTANKTAHPHTGTAMAMDYRKRICRAMNYITLNLGEDLRLEHVAEAAAFSMFHFHRIFKAVVGETVAGFTRRLRLESAANHLIAFPHRDITTIALASGFSTSQNFAKAFRRHFGITPTRFRKSKAGNKCSKAETALSVQTVYDPENLNREHNHVDARIKKMPDYHVAYIRKLGNYDKQTHDSAFEELMQWAVPKGLMHSGPIFGVYWDNPDVTPEGRCRIDACIGIPKKIPAGSRVSTQSIRGGTYVTTRVEIPDHLFKTAWDDLFAWIVRKGYEFADRPNYQIYRNNGAHHPGGIWIVDLYVPVASPA